MAKANIFLDTSVLITALLSPKGASSYMLTNLTEQYSFQINEYVFAETLDVLSRKFPKKAKQMKQDLMLVITLAEIEILPLPSKESLQKVKSVIEKEDAPILISALKHSHILLSLDNDFLNKVTRTFALKNKLKILRPGEFLKQRKKGSS